MEKNNLENYTEILKNLNSFPILGAFSKDEVTEFLSYTEIKKIKSGEKIFSQGDSPEAIYLIAEGEIKLEYEIDSKIYNLKNYKKGDCFGQLALALFSYFYLCRRYYTYLFIKILFSCSLKK